MEAGELIWIKTHKVMFYFQQIHSYRKKKDTFKASYLVNANHSLG